MKKGVSAGMKLEGASVEWALNSLLRNSDTDLFPRPIEINILEKLLPDAVNDITKLNISNHNPTAPRRFIVPKDDLSYRVASQLDPLDSIILTSLVYAFGKGIEARRRPTSEKRVFSYRFSPSVNGDLWQTNDSWNDFWGHCRALSEKYQYVLVTDISDFYNQIYHHTVENQLIESGFPNPAIKWINRLLGTLTAKVSRGIPVGPHAAHILAEAALIPVDNSLLARGLTYCRYVDDIMIFISGKREARRSLSQLAEILDKQQRLHLNRCKTSIYNTCNFQSLCDRMVEDQPLNDLERDLLNIVRLHSDGNPYHMVRISDLSEEELRSFSPAVVEKILSEYLSKEEPNFVRLRWFIRRLAQVGHPAAVEYILDNFDEMLPAVSEICRYFMSVGVGASTVDWETIGDRLINLLDSDIVKSNEYIQLSILHLFGKTPQLNHIARLIRKYREAPPYNRRKIILAAAASGAVDWLRELKEEVSVMDPWSKRAYLYAAYTLPADERSFFLRSVHPQGLLDKLIIRWAKA
ncbi:MAG TPA: Retron-type reverse transcriptase [Firmicutes bacterium]|nr:Retron-type reverse transcriptase [Bacillota bacterium]